GGVVLRHIIFLTSSTKRSIEPSTSQLRMILEDQATTSTLMPPAQGKFRTRRVLSVGYLLTCASAPVGACLSLLDRQDVRTQYDILSVLPFSCHVQARPARR